jgi:SAM-dependent methyltransferase
MLARARSDAESDGLKNAAFIEGDAQTYDFETGSFDSVISRFGVMFFSDPVTAFANLRRATKRGGKLAFVCWQPLTENEWLLVPGAALAEYVLLPDPGPPDAPGMFAFADPDRVRGLLAKAGWDVTEITSLRPSIQIGGSPSLDEAMDFLRTGSLGRAVLASVDPQTEERAVGSVRAALRPYSDSDGVRLSAAVWVVKATS